MSTRRRAETLAALALASFGATAAERQSLDEAWCGSVGIIVGARWFVAGRNTNATVTPMAAINLLF